MPSVVLFARMIKESVKMSVANHLSKVLWMRKTLNLREEPFGKAPVMLMEGFHKEPQLIGQEIVCETSELPQCGIEESDMLPSVLRVPLLRESGMDDVQLTGLNCEQVKEEIPWGADITHPWSTIIEPKEQEECESMLAVSSQGIGGENGWRSSYGRGFGDSVRGMELGSGDIEGDGESVEGSVDVDVVSCFLSYLIDEMIICSKCRKEVTSKAESILRDFEENFES